MRFVSWLTILLALVLAVRSGACSRSRIVTVTVPFASDCGATRSAHANQPETETTFTAVLYRAKDTSMKQQTWDSDRCQLSSDTCTRVLQTCSQALPNHRQIDETSAAMMANRAVRVRCHGFRHLQSVT